jgi:hypothetical protein
MFSSSNPEWQKLIAEITSGIKEWVDQHPKATLAEIERETMRRMAQLQARLLEDLLRAKAVEQSAAEGESVLCPECGAPMQARGEQERHLQAQGGQDVVLKRGYAVCPQCRAAFFPPG